MSQRVLIAASLIGVLTAVVIGVESSAAAAQRPDRPTFSTQSELVVLHVVVKDRRGTYVTNLAPDAFTIFEDGERQAIQFFGMQDSPVTGGLVVDSSGSMLEIRDRVAAAVAAFVETSNPRDEIFALAFNDAVRAALPQDQPFTSDANVLRAALGAISAQGRTALHDAVWAGLDYLALGTHQAKVLVVVSDGADNASSRSFEDLLRKAQVSNTVIYTVAFTDPVERDANPKRLRRLAETSGGEAFEPRAVTEVTSVLERIARDIRNTYTIGYVPTNTAHDNRMRRLRVAVKAADGRELRVRTRHGYVAEQP
jgi:VWFA-related protein